MNYFLGSQVQGFCFWSLLGPRDFHKRVDEQHGTPYSSLSKTKPSLQLFKFIDGGHGTPF